MNMEELTVVMETITALGETGKGAFVWWLVLDKLLPVIGWLSSLGIVSCLAPKVISMIQKGCDGEAYLKELRDRWEIGSSGYLSSDELRAIKKRILLLERTQKETPPR